MMSSTKLIFSVLLGGLFLTFALSGANSVEVEPAVFRTLEKQGTVNILLSFKGSDTARVRSVVDSQEFEEKHELRSSLYQGLKNHSDITQENVLQFLNTQSGELSQNVHRFWITNNILIKNADPLLVNRLLEMQDLSQITEEKYFELDKTIPIPLNESSFTAAGVQAGEEWGVVAIEAPAVWNMGFRGAGIVVGHIDTGVRGTHEALRSNYRSSYGWLDPITRSSFPVDDQGHGTHTLGTIVGQTSGIGVAPSAQWMSCKGCNSEGMCWTADIYTCAEWILCPDPPNCRYAPDLVSNSWGGGSEDTQYDPIIAAWVTAGIIPIFSAGNEGQDGCSSVGSPGTHPQVIGVGSVSSPSSGSGYQVSFFSSRGPSRLSGSRIQPDVVAPGSVVRSASHQFDNVYVGKQGTSMAAPHVAGLVALLYNKRGNLTVSQVRTVLINGVTTENISPTYGTCGSVRDTTYPNNHAGYGLVNARNSIAAIDNLLGSAETIASALKQKEFIILFSILLAFSKFVLV